MTEHCPSRAQVVIIGGGIIGTSVAYHLTKLGWTDVVLLEQGRLSSGTTWHAAGLVGQLRATESGTRLVQYSAELYAALEAETGLSTGYKRCRRRDRRAHARTGWPSSGVRPRPPRPTTWSASCSPRRRRASSTRSCRSTTCVGAIWLPGDGTANPTDLTQSLARGARQRRRPDRREDARPGRPRLDGDA